MKENAIFILNIHENAKVRRRR